ncbi:MAG: hypothetical protein Ct9H300mP16_16560 [Pseudomonadota bacterium]|nr:MAG: hypothetical protein Ct9H300mP16_16560 [Pseudomonadota bacterium]
MFSASPASLHNRPGKKIPPLVGDKIDAQAPHYSEIFGGLRGLRDRRTARSSVGTKRCATPGWPHIVMSSMPALRCLTVCGVRNRERFILQIFWPGILIGW